MYRNIGNKFISWTYMYTAIKFDLANVIQTDPSKFDERLFSETERQTDRKRQTETDRESPLSSR